MQKKISFVFKITFMPLFLHTAIGKAKHQAL
jgi:hypothetical protein